MFFPTSFQLVDHCYKYVNLPMGSKNNEGAQWYHMSNLCNLSNMADVEMKTEFYVFTYPILCLCTVYCLENKCLLYTKLFIEENV